MDDPDLTTFATRLYEAREALMSGRDGSVGSRATGKLDQNSLGRLSRADAIQAQSAAMATERHRPDLHRLRRPVLTVEP